MDKIIEFINTKTQNNYQNLVLESAIYQQKTSTMQLIFKTQKTIQNNDEIEVLCKAFIGNIVKNIEVEIKSNSITMENFKSEVKNIINQNRELVSVNPANITFQFNKDNTKIIIPYLEDAISQSVLTTQKLEIQEFISQKFLCNAEIVFEIIKQNKTDIISARKEKIYEDNYILEELANSQIVSVSNLSNIIGEISTDTGRIAGTLGFESGDIVIVGFLKNLTKREVKKKDESDPTKFYYAIELEYDSLTTSGVWFPPKDAEELKIAVGTSLAILGTINEFKGIRNIRIKSIAQCNFAEPKQVWRKAPQDYRYVRPEKYESLEQANFFTVLEDTKNEYLKNNTFVVYDLETTGISPEQCKIIDIGAFKIVNGKITEKFSTFVNPCMPIPEEASKINHITDEMVATMPTIDDVLPDFYKFCEGSTILGYNNIAFDDLFIKKESKRLRYNFNHQKEDAFNLAKDKIKGLRNYKLGTVCAHMGVPLIDAHRATNDALATAKLFIKLIENYS